METNPSRRKVANPVEVNPSHITLFFILPLEYKYKESPTMRGTPIIDCIFPQFHAPSVSFTPITGS
jgi:hypothetical protein